MEQAEILKNYNSIFPLVALDVPISKVLSIMLPSDLKNQDDWIL